MATSGIAVPQTGWSKSEGGASLRDGSRLAIVAILLVGLFLRSAAIGPMEGMLTFDEAYNGIDALSMLRSPRLTPFLADNNGRESAWVYLLTPFVAVFGARAFGMRLVAVMTGVLTLAASYALGRQILGRRGAVWASGVLCVLYWHVHISHVALRANLFLLAGMLAFVALLHAHRKNALRPWIVSGLAIGFLGYTYFSAYLWIACAFLLLAGWFIREPGKRRGTVVAGLVAIVVLGPMALYALRHSQQFLLRAESVEKLSWPEIAQNLRLWAGAWLQRGDPFPEYNVPRRPALDRPLTVLVLAGLAGLPLAVRRRRYILWIALLAVASLLPSLLSDQAPHFLRALGLTLPLALLAGAGAWGLERLGGRLGLRRLAVALPAALLAASGLVTYRDFTVRWFSHPEVFTRLEAHANRAALFIKDATPSDTPVYFSPLSPSHPVVAFRSAYLAPRPVGAFDSHYCQVVSDRPAAYVSVTLFEPDFQQRLSPWVDLAVVDQDEFEDPPRYTVFRATPRPGALEGGRGPVTFGDALELRSLTPISATARAGATIPIQIGLRALRRLDRVYSVFVHLYGDPTPYEGGKLWSQGDSQVHDSYPPSCWRLDETFIQEFRLPIPADIPPGRYTIALGIYEAPDGPRLPITAPAPQPRDYFAVQEVEIAGP